MNKRMREPFYTLLWKASIGYNDSWSQVDPEVLEKFAELIVQECIKQARDIGDLRGVNDDMIYGADISALTISKYFGVE